MNSVSDSRAGRWARRQLERLLGVWAEGPRPPTRALDAVAEFALRNPPPTRGEWARFAAHHAMSMYAQGYLRGYEHAERDPDWYRRLDPNKYADAIDPGWRDNDPITDIELAGIDEPPRDVGFNASAVEHALRRRHKSPS